MRVPNTREEYRRAVYTTFKIDKTMLGPASPCPLDENSKSNGATLIHPRFRANDCGITIAEIARQVGVSPSAISKSLARSYSS